MTTKDKPTLADVIEEALFAHLNLTCPHCDRLVYQYEEIPEKIARATKTWILDKFSKWVDNRIMDTKNFPGYWDKNSETVYKERIDTLNNALTNLKNILEG